MLSHKKIDVVYERQWNPLNNLIAALISSGHMGKLYGGFPKFRYAAYGIPPQIIRTFPIAALYNHLLQKVGLPKQFRLNEPRWIGKWVARQKGLAPIIWANGTAFRFLFPNLKDHQRMLILERGSSHPEDVYWLPQLARKEAGLPYSNELPTAIIDEIQKISLCDFIIAGSQMITESYVSRGYPKERIFSVSYGINPSAYPLVQRKVKDSSTIVIGIAGIVGFRKGFNRMLRIGEWAAERGFDVELRFAGPLYDRECLGLLATSQAKCTLLGTLKGEDLIDFYHSLDVIALPSYEDGFGLSVLEGMSTGLPAIVSSKTGAKEAIKNSVNGAVLSQFSYQEFDTVLKPWLENPESLATMGQEARKAVEAQFTQKHYEQRLQTALKKILVHQRS
ncbi:MAG: glycosyltransferase family 4 protein [Verrucomicrobiota bacterium]